MAKEEKKHSIVETGHGKNVSNLDKLIAVLLSFGTKYAPSNANITIAALQALYPILLACIKQVSDDAISYSLDVDARQDSYEFMASTSTGALNILRSSGATKRQIQDANSIVKKLRGEKITTIASEPSEQTPLLEPGETGLNPAAENDTVNKVKRSVSQRSYDSRIEHFSELVKLLSAISKYNPNEIEYTIATLSAYIANLSTLNHNVNTSGSQLQKSRRERNVLLYGKETGLLDLTRAIKSYVRGLYRYNSPESKEVNRITFTDF